MDRRAKSSWTILVLLVLLQVVLWRAQVALSAPSASGILPVMNFESEESFRELVLKRQAGQDAGTKPSEEPFWLIVFHSPSCPHCVAFLPIFEEFAKLAGSKLDFAAFNNVVRMGKVDCASLRGLCIQQSIHAVPTVQIYHQGVLLSKLPASSNSVDGLTNGLQAAYTQVKNEAAAATAGGLGNQAAQQDLDLTRKRPVAEIAQNGQATGVQGQGAQHHPFLQELDMDSSKQEVPNPNGEVTILTDANFDEKTKSGLWLLEFFAPWCPHCQHLAPTWKDLGARMKGIANIGSIDCTTEKGLGDRFGIRGFPTIKLLKDGNYTDYDRDRGLETFVKFILENIPPRTHISASQVAYLQGQYKNFFVYYYLPDIPSNEFDKTYVSLVHQYGQDAKFFLSTDHEFIRMMGQAHAPSVLAFLDGRASENGGPVQMPVSNLANYELAQEWILESLYPYLAPVTAGHAPIILAGNKLVFLSIVDLQGANADGTSQANTPAASFDANLKPVLEGIARDVKKYYSQVRFAYLDGVQFAAYVKRVYADVNSGNPVAALPFHVLIDPANEVYYLYDVETKGLDSAQIKRFIEQSQAGELSGHYARGTFSRMTGALTSTIGDSFEYVKTYPFFVLFMSFLLVMVLVFVGKLFRSKKESPVRKFE